MARGRRGHRTPRRPVAGWIALALAAVLVVAPSARAPAPPAASRAAMAASVVRALGLPQGRPGPRYADVAPGAPAAGAIEAGANAGLWGWQPGARFDPATAATFGQALAALVAGLGDAAVAADLPQGLRRTAQALGLWPAQPPPLDARLAPPLLRWLVRQAPRADAAAVRPLAVRTVRAIVWEGAGGDVLAGQANWVQAVAVDRDGRVVDVPVRVSASAGRWNPATDTWTAPDAPQRVLLTARAPGGVRSSQTLNVETATALAISPVRGAGGRAVSVEVTVLGPGGAAVDADSDRAITLALHQGGRTRRLTVADQAGVAPFSLRGLSAGPAVLTASAPGLPTTTREVRVPTPAPPEAAPPRASRASAGLFAGKGLWLPYWVWSASRPATLVAQARRAGVRTVYLEVATSHDGFYGRGGLGRLLAVAGPAGIRVVAWVYADLAQPVADLHNLRAVLAYRSPQGLRPAGLALDLEGSAPLPGWALVEELAAARRALGAGGSILAAVYPPGGLAPPYRVIARYASAIAPMDYWHGQMRVMGYDAAYAQVAASVRAIRAQAGAAAVTPALQVFDIFTPSQTGAYAPSAGELAGAVAAARAAGAAGVSFYQWGTASPAEWRVVDQPWPDGGRVRTGG